MIWVIMTQMKIKIDCKRFPLDNIKNVSERSFPLQNGIGNNGH